VGLHGSLVQRTCGMVVGHIGTKSPRLNLLEFRQKKLRDDRRRNIDWLNQPVELSTLVKARQDAQKPFSRYKTWLGIGINDPYSVSPRRSFRYGADLYASIAAVEAEDAGNAPLGALAALDEVLGLTFSPTDSSRELVNLVVVKAYMAVNTA